MRTLAQTVLMSLGLVLVSVWVNSARGQSWTFTSGPHRPHLVTDLSAAVHGTVQTIYAADAETLKVSTNGGVTWQNLFGPVTNVVAVATKPDDSTLVHIAKNVFLWKSTDGGWDWTSEINDNDLVPLRLTVSPVNTSTWMLGADTVLRSGTWKSSLYRTPDGGQNWTAHSYFKDYAHTCVNDVVWHPSNGGVWAGGSRNPVSQSPDMTDESSYCPTCANKPTKGVWYSADSGATWSFQALANGTDRNVTALAYSKMPTGDLLFAVTTEVQSSTRKAILYQSANGGSGWGTTVDLYSAIGAGYVSALKAHPVNPETLVAATDKGFAVSTDRGATWSTRTSGIQNVKSSYQIMFDRKDATGNTVYMATDQSVLKSTDLGQTWSTGFQTFNFLNTTGFGINGSTSHAVSSLYSGIARYSGGAWNATPAFAGNKQFSGQSAAINFTNTQYANACGDSSGYATIEVRTDGADGWRKAFSSGTNGTEFHSLAPDPKSNSQRVYAGGTFTVGGTNYNFATSTDLGVTWPTRTLVGLNFSPVLSIAVDAASGSTYSQSIYAGLGDTWGVRKSMDGGSTWSAQKLNGNTISAIAMNPSASSSILYLGSIGSQASIWKSTDSLHSNPTFLTGVGASRMIMHPSYPNSTNFVWAIAANDSQIYRTTDGGSSWIQVNISGLPLPLTDMERDPANDSLIFVGTPAGIYTFNPPPEAPTGLAIAGSNCTAVSCPQGSPSGGPDSPTPCHPVVSWSANQEADLSTSSTYRILRSWDGGGYSAIGTATSLSYTDAQVTITSTGTHTAAYEVQAMDAAGNYSSVNGHVCVYASGISPIAGRPRGPVNEDVAYEFRLFQNTPNPFNPTTSIHYTLPSQLPVHLIVFNILGQEVKTLVDGIQSAGPQVVSFDASDLASGVYFYRLHAGNYIDTKKMMLVR